MGRVRTLGFAYRQWAKDILTIVQHYGFDLRIETDRNNVSKEYISNYNPDLILFYGWSWIVPDFVIDNYMALCLHPSPLPKYRGGSPIQNQILNGEKESSVSIFRMTKGVDEGPLCAQVAYSLEGSIKDVLARIRYIGIMETRRVIEEHGRGGIKFHSQEGEATVFQRRQPEQSEITWDELQKMPALYLYNKIRCLQDPYPNAFITCADGMKLYLTGAYCAGD